MSNVDIIEKESLSAGKRRAYLKLVLQQIGSIRFFQENSMDYRFVRTTCPFCGCGCQMLLEVMDGKLIGTLPLKKAPMNQGKVVHQGLECPRVCTQPEEADNAPYAQEREPSGGFLG